MSTCRKEKAFAFSCYIVWLCKLCCIHVYLIILRSIALHPNRQYGQMIEFGTEIEIHTVINIEILEFVYENKIGN